MPHLFTIIVAGILFYVGFVQTFWGNDPYLGWGITVIAGLVFVEPAGYIMARFKLSGRRYEVVLGVTLVVVLWISLGVGELWDKTQLMLEHLPMPHITGF
jgi:ABC-type maltose transport system permease subunit